MMNLQYRYIQQDFEYGALCGILLWVEPLCTSSTAGAASCGSPCSLVLLASYLHHQGATQNEIQRRALRVIQIERGSPSHKQVVSETYSHRRPSLLFGPNQSQRSLSPASRIPTDDLPIGAVQLEEPRLALVLGSPAPFEHTSVPFQCNSLPLSSEKKFSDDSGLALFFLTNSPRSRPLRTKVRL